MNRSRFITSVTPAVCGVLGVDPPAGSDREVPPALSGVRAGRVLVYAPDAIGTWLVRRERERFDRVRSLAPIEVDLRSVSPTKTPVCFASMFSGLTPEEHGIRRYEKRVLECETLFDVATRAYLPTAIVAVRDSSIDRIFSGRPVDRYPEEYDPEVTERAVELLARDEHALIVAYHQEYDDAIHRTHPLSEEAIGALERHVLSFERLVRAARTAWSDRGGVVMFTPDHGVHTDSETGRGTHGSDLPEDMEVSHFYGIVPPV
jgi:hypothetical protein